MLAESYAGANRDLGLQQQLLRELHRPQPAILLWNLCPGEHRSLRQFHRPSQPVQPRHQHIPPSLVVIPNLRHTILRPFQRCNRSHLNRRKRPIVEVALDPSQRRNQRAVPHHEAHTPTRHVVALREREELDRNILRSGNLEYARRAIAIEHNVGIRQIMHDINSQLLAQRHDPFEERQLHALRRGVRRKVQNQQLGPGLHTRQLILQPLQQRIRAGVLHRNALHLRSCEKIWIG